MANKQRGEIDITIGDEKITLIPSYLNFSAIESATDRCLMVMTASITQCAMPISQVVSIVEICSGKDQLGQKIFDHGYLEIMQHLGPFLTLGIAGNTSIKAKSSGKAKSKGS